jgi:hypothetical protein
MAHRNSWFTELQNADFSSSQSVVLPEGISINIPVLSQYYPIIIPIKPY